MQSRRKYSEACEQNKDPILKILKEVFKDCETVLEIGSGSGQHAVYFAKHLNHLVWQPSDLYENLSSIQAWIESERIQNVKTPIELDVAQYPWNVSNIEAVFTANTLHIMSWETIKALFKGVGQLLKSNGKFLAYGPFAYNGKHTSSSNARFDNYLKQQDSLSGVRDFVQLDKLANNQGMQCVADYSMPANNRCLLWQKH